MSRIFWLVAGMAFVGSMAVAQPALEPKPEGQNPQQQHPFKTYTFTSYEKAVVFRVIEGNASQVELMMAVDICAKKCKPCHDGVKCNLECAKKTCVESE